MSFLQKIRGYFFEQNQDASSKNKKQSNPVHLSDIENIQKIMQAINNTYLLDAISQQIVDMMIEALDCVGGALLLVEERENVLRPATHSRINSFVNKVIPLLGKKFEDHVFDLKHPQNFTARTVTAKKMFIGQRYEEFMTPVVSKFTAKMIQKVAGLKTIITAPSIINNTVLGVLMVGFREKDLPERKMQLLRIFADQCAVAINNAQKYEKLHKQYEEIRNLLRQQSDFITVAAHEFRTPLNIAILHLQDTIESYKLVPGVIENMKVMGSSLDSLKDLTMRLFETQQFDLNKITLTLTKKDIGEFMEQLCKEFKSLMMVKKIELSFKNSFKKKVKLLIDEKQIRQVIHNILTNASKFTPAKGKILLEIREQKEKILIRIEDNGPGIEDKDKERIFEKFQTTNATMGMGIGLGLYICKKTVELHKGKIWVEDTPGGGATFCIALPK